MILALLAALVVAPRDTQVNVHVARNVAPAPRIQINLNTQNLPTVQMRVYRLDPIGWFTSPNQSKRPLTTTKPVREFPITVARPGQRPLPAPNDNWYSRTINLPNMSPGVYLIDAGVAGAKGQSWAVVNVTQLAVVSKRSPKQALVWVTDFKSGAPVVGASANLYCRGIGLIGSAKTNKDGIAQLKVASGEDTLVVLRDKDAAGLPSVGFNPDGRLVSHVQTDRPIYRPGQRGGFKVVLRRTNGQGFTFRGIDKVMMTLRDPMDTVLDRQTLAANEFGAVSGGFELPTEGALGPYTLVFEVGKETVYHTVTVAAYRKPEYKVTMAAGQKRALAGESISFNLRAETYFGAPVPNALVNYTIRRDSLGYWGADAAAWTSDDGNLYASDTYGSSDVVENDEAYTDEKGNLTITHKTDPKAPDATYSIEATVTDGSRRQVEGSASMPVYAAAVRLGLRTSSVCVPLGRLVPIQVQISDLDGRPAPGAVKLQAWEDVWDEKKGEYVPVERASSTVVVPASGKITAQLPAKVLGTMRITGQVKDPTGRVAKSTISTYVVGPDARTVRENEGPSMSVRPEQRSVAPGGVMTAYAVSNRKPGSAFRKGDPAASAILITMEGADLFAYRVVRASDVPLQVRATDAHFPNVTVSAVQWVQGYAQSANTEIAIADRTRALDVTVESDKSEYAPGDKAKFTIRTRNAKGGPVSAEVAFSLVDEAIFALRPDDTADIYRRFWGPRNNMVTTYESAPQEVSGGAYQRVSSLAPVRQRFEDTASWQAHVRTGASGVATVEVEMPGNLTQWRATARAMTEDTRAGTTRGSVRATRAITLRLATPRQMVPGDRLQLIATVNNRTPEARRLTVRLQEGERKVESRTLEVAAQSEGRATFDIEAKQLGVLDLIADVADGSGDPTYADALRLRVPVIPAGVSERIVVAGTVTGSADAKIELPADAISEATRTRIRIWAGLTPLRDRLIGSVLTAPRTTTYAAIAHLRAAVLLPVDQRPHKEIREAIALLSRTQSNYGWGWWEGDQARPEPTADVLWALALAKEANIEIPDRLWNAAKGGADRAYVSTNLWEQRARLAASLALAKNPESASRMEEVATRGIHLSPYSRLLMAEVRLRMKQPDPARAIADALWKEASEGPSQSYLPVGEGIGWVASETETNAKFVEVLVRLGQIERADLVINTLAERASRGWVVDHASVAEALAAVLRARPEAATLGQPQVSLEGGGAVALKPDALGQSLIGDVPLGKGVSTLRISGVEGTLRYEIESTVYRPIRTENVSGVRVIRRYEVRNSAGAWVELDRVLKPNEPVRCTVVVWGDSVPDALKINQPIPAGFEYVEDEPMGTFARQEVRDGAVVHYVFAGGEPLSFRYYLRAESGGTLTILPATAEVIRRPSVRGQTSQSEVKVGG